MSIRTSAIEKVARPITQSQDTSTKKVADKDVAFDEILKGRITHKQSIKFSGHAQKRIRTRNINLTLQDLNKIENAVSKAADKGAGESLLIMDDLALIVSVKNRTVITAFDGDNLRDNVFTNIDSAVIVDST